MDSFSSKTPIAVHWLEDSTPEVMARIEDWPTAPNTRGAALLEEDLSAITYEVHELAAGSSTVTVSGQLAIPNVIFDELQGWAFDGVGHNFRARLPITAFPTGNSNYRLEVKWTHTDTRVGFTCWEGAADNVFSTPSGSGEVSPCHPEPTEDSTAVIQALLNAGGAVVLPEGNYLVGPLTFPSHVTSITGAPPGACELALGLPSATTLKLKPNSSGFARIFYVRHQVPGNRTVAFSQFMIDMNRYNQGPYTGYQMAHQAAIFCTAEDSSGFLTVTIDDVKVFNSAGDGIYVHERAIVTITNHISSGIFRGGVVQTGHNSTLALTDSDLSDDSGIDIEPNSDSHVVTATMERISVASFDVFLTVGSTFNGDDITGVGSLFINCRPGSTFVCDASDFTGRFNFRLPHVTFTNTVFRSPAAGSSNVIFMAWADGAFDSGVVCTLTDCDILGPATAGIHAGNDAAVDGNTLNLTNVNINGTTRAIQVHDVDHGTWNFVNVLDDGVPVLAA